MKPRPSDKILLANIQSKISDADLVCHYLGVTKIPTVISSPLRQDNKPSFGLYSSDGKKIRYKDLATNDSGGIYDLLMKLWGCNLDRCLQKINKELVTMESSNLTIKKTSTSIQTLAKHKSNIELQVKIRDWKQYDVEYWESYGIKLKWLKYAEVYPISHKIIIKNSKKYVFGADKYAYVFIERKEGKITKKVYQPFNTNGYKWSNDNNSSIIGLWSKLPQTGEKVCICSSLKDALCLWSNTGIPSIYLQGEGYNMSETAINELYKRFKHVFICFDSDEAGKSDSYKLAMHTGFFNAVLPHFDKMKDISDLYKGLGIKRWKEIILPLFDIFNPDYNDLPF